MVNRSISEKDQGRGCRPPDFLLSADSDRPQPLPGALCFAVQRRPGPVPLTRRHLFRGLAGSAGAWGCVRGQEHLLFRDTVLGRRKVHRVVPGRSDVMFRFDRSDARPFCRERGVSLSLCRPGRSFTISGDVEVECVPPEAMFALSLHGGDRQRCRMRRRAGTPPPLWMRTSQPLCREAARPPPSGETGGFHS